uniref:Uncharacterized protein n=1 Tax=Helicotheca tamesis TaxID=374047 RepID=A0A7S2I3F1_9STRA|mmetsp:Transcript_5274/g.7227  ORF Transcript_5274/g.7227 Transcript_5274/m.7227 type:complete len:178 (+) Transcript_5274:207-740(+)|eukprot:CAMPEP_0185729576 /NCGR_PEP_ID=MMETSP1171-20130828/6386_1 /TAXON_ID=374046 /ORGANISM="Helicotheca tamensis, Strain CCMP826" /LENGTH=177 /DNA_ID=CAMNT_0028398447 /DNA_START=156 /DNA_END=689 /DNA_ORIENTATION=-
MNRQQHIHSSLMNEAPRQPLNMDVCAKDPSVRRVRFAAYPTASVSYRPRTEPHEKASIFYSQVEIQEFKSEYRRAKMLNSARNRQTQICRSDYVCLPKQPQTNLQNLQATSTSQLSGNRFHGHRNDASLRQNMNESYLHSHPSPLFSLSSRRAVVEMRAQQNACLKDRRTKSLARAA